MRAVITGASRGIGRSIADAFTSAGYEVVAVDIEFDQANPFGAEVHQVVGDVRDSAVHVAAAATGSRRLTAWVNNAGVAPAAPLRSLEQPDFDRTIGVNLGGAIWGSQAALNAMVPNGAGSIVNISSTQSRLGFDDYPVYAATKGAIEALTRQIASQYAPSGVRCNAVAPGVIETQLNRDILAEAADPTALVDRWMAMCPVGRLGRPEDVAQAVTWLCDEAQSFVTGQVIVVDGGQTVRPLSEPT